MNDVPSLITPRLRLRPFALRDVQAVLELYGDMQVNTFLPWYPIDTAAQARAPLEDWQREETCRRWAVCPLETDAPVGYVTLENGAPHDLGYALRRDCWGRGYATEAAQAVLDFARRDGMPYVTATHDVCNPASGRVMRRLGLCYCYSYVEQWQPKDILVTFRLYQRSLDGAPHPAYDGYWNRYPKHFFEEI